MRDYGKAMIVIRLFMQLSFMFHLAAVAPGLLMPRSFMLPVQIWMQLTVLMCMLKIRFLEV